MRMLDLLENVAKYAPIRKRLAGVIYDSSPGKLTAGTFYEVSPLPRQAAEFPAVMRIA